MKLLSKLALLMLPIPLVMAAPLQGPHKHGTLAVAVIKEDSFLRFKMVVPSQDLLGFEGSPKSPKQKKTLNDQYAKLHKESALPKLFQFEPANACFPYSANMESDMLTYHEHDEHHKAEDEKSQGEGDTHKVGDVNGHSDFELTYVFECDPVEGVKISFSDVFPSIKRVDFYDKGELKGKVLRSTDASKAVISAQDLQ